MASTTTTREQPFNVSAWEIRAIRDGRKTQTRRIVNPQPTYELIRPVVDRQTGEVHAYCDPDPTGLVFPFGQPGEMLWLRETWTEVLHTSTATDEPVLCDGDKLIEHATYWIDDSRRKRWRYDGRVICYRTTSPIEFCDGDGFHGDMADRSDMPRWKSPACMPRWASRETLRIKSVRIERLQEISGPDCWAEGIESAGWDCTKWGSVTHCYEDLWASTNGPDTWDANPFVWVIEHERVTK